MQKDIHIALITNNTYIQHTATLLASILTNKSSTEMLVIYILHANLNEKHMRQLYKLKSLTPFKIIFKKVDITLFSEFPKAHYKEYTYFKLLIPTLLKKHCSRVLYLDSDMIVLKSLGKLYNTILPKGCFLGAVPDAIEYLDWTLSRKKLLGITDKKPYFNAGLLLYDLKKIKSPLKLFSDCKSWAINNPQLQRYADQDILNALFHKDYCPLPLQYNFGTILSKHFIYRKDKHQEILSAKENPIIIHYTTRASQKPWMYTSVDRNRHWYRKYQKLTPWGNAPLLEDTASHRLLLPFIALRSALWDIIKVPVPYGLIQRLFKSKDFKRCRL